MPTAKRETKQQAVIRRCKAGEMTLSGGAQALGISLAAMQILWELELLRKAPEEDDFGRIRPSEAAIEAASEAVRKMSKTPGGLPSPADVSTDRDGAIRILWENEDRALELVCPFDSSQRPYFYYAEGREYTLAHDLSVYRLGRLLAWLAGALGEFPR